MASKKLCEFWKPDRYGEGKGGCYAAGEEGNIVCLTEGELGDNPLPDCMSYPFGITADRDRERARAEAAEKRVAELEKDAERLAGAGGVLRIHVDCCREEKCVAHKLLTLAIGSWDEALRTHEALKEAKDE